MKQPNGLVSLVVITAYAARDMLTPSSLTTLELFECAGKFASQKIASQQFASRKIASRKIASRTIASRKITSQKFTSQQNAS